MNPQNDKAEPSANPDAQPAFSAAGLLDDLWHHLKVLDGRCTKSMAIALTRRGYDQIEGQRAMARELQSYLLAHGYSSNNQALRPATEGEPERNKTNL